MTTGPGNLADLARAVLTSIVEAFDLDGVDLPPRRYLDTGTPVDVCDALVLTWENLHSGSVLGGEPPSVLDAGRGRVVDLVAYIFRCGYPVPQGQGIAGTIEPTTDNVTDFAATVMTDAYVLHRGVQRASRLGTFTGYSSRVVLGAAEPIQPEGQQAGVRMVISMAVL